MSKSDSQCGLRSEFKSMVCVKFSIRVGWGDEGRVSVLS